MAAASALAFGIKPRGALAGESAVGIHRATRNTLLGALGAGLRQMQGPPALFKAYAGNERVRLGDRPTAAGPSLVQVLAATYRDGDEQGGSALPAGASQTLTLTTLARLLYFTNGDTGRGDDDPYKLRAAPSAGALYAGELYVIALAVEGLERGVYYYDVGSHELVRVSRAGEPLAIADAFEDATPANAAALICISNVFERYKRRYSNRGYRYALVDTGHIGENLKLAAAAAEIAHRALPRFADDRIHAILGIDGQEESACAVHALGGQAAAAAPPPAQSHFAEKGQTDAQVAAEPEPTLRYHDATKLVAAAATRKRHGARNALRHEEALAAPASDKVVALATPEAEPAASVEQCIASRRSPLGFAKRAISQRQLGFVTRCALPALAARRSLGIDLLLAVHRVEDIDAGLYRYLPDRRAVALVRQEDLSETLPRACLGQSKAGDAAVGFIIVGHVRRSALRHGERAYRDLLIEAGEIGERIYLAAEALGLSARNLAAFLDEDLNNLLALDGQERAVIHLTMLGHGA